MNIMTARVLIDRHLPYTWDAAVETMTMWIAWRMPRKLVYWCAIRLMAHATQGRWSNTEVPALTGMEALSRWETWT